MQILRGKTALILGASQGIGLACAHAFAQDGATVVITGRREEALKKAKAHVIAQCPGAQIEILSSDACQEEDVKNSVNFAYGLNGRLDILIAAVGGPTLKPLLMRDLASVRQEMDLNFTSAFLAVRYGAPLMQRGGSIVCLSSTGASQAMWGLSVYAAAKGAVERFVRAAAFELGGAGIRVNAVRPGMTRPKGAVETAAMAKMIEAFAARIPMGRVGEPNDIARVVRFLAGPESAWVTGQIMSADGGQDQTEGPDFMDNFYGQASMTQIRAGKAIAPDTVSEK